MVGHEIVLVFHSMIARVANWTNGNCNVPLEHMRYLQCVYSGQPIGSRFVWRGVGGIAGGATMAGAFVGVQPLCVRGSGGAVGEAVCGRSGRACVVVRRSVARHGGGGVQMVSSEAARAAVAAYGVVVAGGGVGAFLKSGSKMSAISGVVAGAVLAAAYVRSSVPVALGTALALMVVFIVRLVATKKMMPAGMLAILSGLFAMFFGYTIFFV